MPAGSVVLAEDETHSDLFAKVRARWIRHGMRTLIPTPGSNKRRTLFGVANLATGQWHYQLAVKASRSAIRRATCSVWAFRRRG